MTNQNNAMTLVCPIHTNKELTKLGSCVSCRKRVQGIPKPETAPTPVQALNPTKSAAALRAERYRARQKQLNPDFNKQEKKRKQDERTAKLVKRDTKAQDAEKRAEMLKELLESGQFPKSIALLRTKVGFGVFMKGALQGKGKIVVGDLTPILAVHDSLRIDNLENTAPLKAQLTEEELRAKLRSQEAESRIEILNALIDGDIQEQLPQHIEELLPGNIKDFSIDEINQLFEAVFETVDWLQDLLYPTDDGPQEAKIDLSKPPMEARNTRENEYGDYHGGQNQDEQFEQNKKQVFIAYLPRGPQERAMVKFIETMINGKTIPSCEKCGDQLAPDFNKFVEAGFGHLREKHPEVFQKMLEAIERAGKRIRKCPRGWVHEEVLQQLLGDGTRKVKCRCGKVLYDPEKARKGRSDTLQKAA